MLFINLILFQVPKSPRYENNIGASPLTFSFDDGVFHVVVVAFLPNGSSEVRVCVFNVVVIVLVVAVVFGAGSADIVVAIS